MDSLIINMALTGWVPSRELTPHVPLSVEEIIVDARACLNQGASILHIHAREDDGSASCDPSLYASIIRGIRSTHPKAVITVTTSGRRFSDFSERTAVLELDGIEKPDMASLTLGSLNFPDGASINDPKTITKLAAVMREQGVKPELEVFDLGMINFAKVLIKKNLIRPPYYFNIILGNISSAQVDLLQLAVMMKELPENSICSIGGVGRFQRMANSMGAILTDGVRTGLEDNVWLDAARTELATNSQLLKRTVEVARAAGRAISSPIETRQRLGLE